MLKDFRCDKCRRLLARVGIFTELQIKCSRCGALSHVKAPSLELSPLSEVCATSVTHEQPNSSTDIEVCI